MSESASMTIEATQIGANNYQYTITLKDTGSTPIGTLWFSWVPGAGYLPSQPTFSSPAGWSAHQTDGPPPADGYSIEWTANSGASALQSGKSLDFTFTSSTPPSVLFGKSTIHPPTPVDTSFIYSGAPFISDGVMIAASSSFERILQHGLLVETEDFSPGAASQAFSTAEKDYSAGGDLIGWKYFFTGVTGKPYSAYEDDYDGGGRLTRADFTGVTGQAYSSYERDYVGGVFAGTKYEFTTVPHGAAYSSYEKDYSAAGIYTEERLFYTQVSGQSYTGAERDYDAQGKLIKLIETGVSGKPYTSIEWDYDAGTLAGYKEFFTGIKGQIYNSQERDFSATNALVSVIDTGIARAYSSVEFDYASGKLVDSIYDYTDVKGQTYYADQVEYNANGVKELTTYDLNNGNHNIVGSASGLTLVSLGDDMMTGGGSGEHFVFNAIYGHDSITDFAAHDSGASHDIISLPRTEFANFAAMTAAATNAGANVVITAKDGDTLTLDGLSKATLLTLAADFTFHA
jgi:hypothetical protein